MGSSRCYLTQAFAMRADTAVKSGAEHGNGPKRLPCVLAVESIRASRRSQRPRFDRYAWTRIGGRHLGTREKKKAAAVARGLAYSLARATGLGRGRAPAAAGVVATFSWIRLNSYVHTRAPLKSKEPTNPARIRKGSSKNCFIYMCRFSVAWWSYAHHASIGCGAPRPRESESSPPRHCNPLPLPIKQCGCPPS